VRRVDHLRLPDPDVAVEGRGLECKSWLAYAGAYQLTLWTIVPGLALELHSSYLGHPDGDTAVAHLQLQPSERPAIASEQRPGSELPVREARRLCLYDHLVVLRQLVADHTTGNVSVEVADQALELVDLS
jgi:hypothetical protein